MTSFDEKLHNETPPQEGARKEKLKKKSKKAKTAKGSRKKTAEPKRRERPYPASSFEDALAIGNAIITHAAGDRVRRLTLLEKMQKSPDSSATRMMITNSGKYNITTGSYAAEHLALTEQGKIVVDPASSSAEKLQASFNLALDGVGPFKVLYEHYRGKKLPDREVIKDVLSESSIEVPDLDECVDTFIVNAKYLGLLRTIGGAETLIPIEQALDDTNKQDASSASLQEKPIRFIAGAEVSQDWKKLCFYITPIGSEGSEERKHSDLFLSSLIQPALAELDLTVVRADHIGEPGMITTQILEYIKNAKLAIADLSYLNPNVFYEVALRHALKLPVVQIIRKSDRLPFDVNQLRTLVFDTSDIYSLVPKLQTYRSEIASQARKALEDPESVGNPVSVFYPDFYKKTA